MASPQDNPILALIGSMAKSCLAVRCNGMYVCYIKAVKFKYTLTASDGLCMHIECFAIGYLILDLPTGLLSVRSRAVMESIVFHAGL